MTIVQHKPKICLSSSGEASLDANILAVAFMDPDDVVSIMEDSSFEANCFRDRVDFRITQHEARLAICRLARSQMQTAIEAFGDTELADAMASQLA